MNDITTTARDAIAAYLDRRDLRYEPRGDGFMFAFGSENAPLPEVTLFVSAPPDGGIVVEAAGPQPLEEDRWEAALWTVNEWNATVRAPKAMLISTADAATDAAPAAAHIVLQDWMPYSAAMPDDVLEAFLDVVVSGTCLFWQGGDRGAAEGDGNKSAH